MGEKAKQMVEIRDFPGLILDMDPNDLPMGAAEQQVNVQSNTPGILVSRTGYLELSFEG